MERTVLVTGASKGIDLALAQILTHKNYHVIGTSRSGVIEGLKNKNFEAASLDLTDPYSIDSFVNDLLNQQFKLDLLINNAGIGPDLYTSLPETESFAKTMTTNLTGVVSLTEKLVPIISDGGIIANVSSKMGSINLCSSSDSPAYRISKAGLNMYTKILANREQAPYRVVAIHPGWVKTNIGNNNFQGRLTPLESAESIVAFLDSDFKNGCFWDVETQSFLEW